MSAQLTDWRSSVRWGWGLSVLLHILVVIVMMVTDTIELRLPSFEHTMEVELVPAPKAKPPPPPPPPPPEPSQAQPPKPEPEPARPEPPKPMPKPQMQTPIPPPQLARGKIAERSSAPEPAKAAEAGKAAGAGTTILFQDKGSPEPRHTALAAGELSQSAQDFVLSQVLRMWRFNFAAAKGRGFALSAAILVNRDGTLVGPMSKNAPWAPEEAIPGYDKMPEDSYPKRAMESFLLALRLSQPLELPPDDGKPWPRRMVLRFRFDDL